MPGPDGEPLAIHDFGGNESGSGDGSGTGPTVLFAHATGMHGWMWRGVAAHLADRARCFAPDLRGHGDSPFPVEGDAENDFSWAGFGRDVLAAAAAVNEEAGEARHGGLIGVGHSMGGTSLLLAELAAPGTFRALFLYEPVFGAEPTEETNAHVGFMVSVARKRRASFPSRAEALANFARKLPTSAYQASVLNDYVEHGFGEAESGAVSEAEPGAPDASTGKTGEVRLKCRPDIEAGVYAHSYTPGTAERLPELKCPVTVMLGEHSGEPHASSVAMVARQTGGTALRLDGADHFGPMERPAALAAAIAQHALG